MFVAALTILAAAVYRLLEPPRVATGAPASPLASSRASL
jgi:hypothetical protein